MIMKHITILILITSLTTNIFGQQNKFNIGIEGSPSIIYLRGNAVGAGIDPTFGFSGGLTFQYNFPKILSVRTNIAYERKGAVYLTYTTDNNGTVSGYFKQHFNFDYLTIPILLRASFGKKVNFFMNIGAFGGYLIKEKETFEFTVNTSSLTPIDNTSAFKRIDMGVVFGFGLTVPIKKILLSLELRNNTGLYNIDKPLGAYSPVLKTSSTNLLIGLAYKFGERN